MKIIKDILGFAGTGFKRLDKLLLLLCIIASAFSVCLLYTMVINEINPQVITSRTWKMQLAASGVGIVCAIAMSLIDFKVLSKIWMFTFAPASLVLSLLLFTPMGMSTDGSDEINWLNLGFMQLQPSEFLTVAFIVTLSVHIDKIGDKLNRFPHVMLLCLHALVPIGLMLLQKNTGAPVLLALVFVLMLFAAGLSWKYFAAVAAVVPLLGYAFWNFYANDYHKMRILVIFDKDVQQQEILGFFNQQYLGLTAMGSGGLTGQGLTGGEYITMFAIHNDFIFSYIGMTLGLIGCILVILLMLSICIKLLTVTGVTKEPLGRSVCAGVFGLIFFHTVINVGMVTAVSPVVGVPLPFISAGGSSALSLYIAIGLVLSICADKDKKTGIFG